MSGKLAFIRKPGHGGRLFGNPIYVTPGISRSVSVYDAPENTDGTDVTIWNPNLFASPHPQQARPARRSANFDSMGNAHAFQGGWVTNWSTHYGMRAYPPHTTLTQNNNRNTYGSKEQQRATVYNPWPAAGAIYPKAV